MYKDFFTERTAYYTRRYRNAPKTKTPAELHGGDIANELVLSESANDGEQPPDGLSSVDGGEQ